MAFSTNKNLELRAKNLEDRIVDALLMEDNKEVEKLKKEAKMLLDEQYITSKEYKSFINTDLYKEMYGLI